jgi:hypothetical protein
VNEQQMSGEQKISRVNDSLHLQAMKATYYEIVEWRISSIRFIQEG